MIECTGDLWDFPADFRCITTNGIVSRLHKRLVMGAGTALQAKQKYPDLPNKLGKWVNEYGNRPFICFNEKIITFPTKHNYTEDSDLNLIITSACKITEIVNKYSINKVVLTRPGCGNGNLDWEIVRPEISHIFDDRFVIVNKE